MAGKLKLSADHLAALGAILAAICSGLAAIAGFQAAHEAGAQARIATEEAALDRQVALVRSCGSDISAEFKDGDDILEITGAAGEAYYTSELDRPDFTSRLSSKPERFLHCRFRNYSRVPILTVFYFVRIGYHHGRKQTTEHNFPFPALAPGQERSVWIVNTDNEAVSVRTPDRARYARFPNLTEYKDQRFLPVLRDYWVLRRSDDPIENLDESMM